MHLIEMMRNQGNNKERPKGKQERPRMSRQASKIYIRHPPKNHNHQEGFQGCQKSTQQNQQSIQRHPKRRPKEPLGAPWETKENPRGSGYNTTPKNICLIIFVERFRGQVHMHSEHACAARMPQKIQFIPAAFSNRFSANARFTRGTSARAPGSPHGRGGNQPRRHPEGTKATQEARCNLEAKKNTARD